MLLLCLTLLAILPGNLAVQCLDGNGKAVPWWFISKLPDGFRYYYKDSSDSSGSLKMSSVGLDNVKTPLGQTLTQIYSNMAGVSHVAYNDELPEGETLLTEPAGGAHAKGVVGAQGSTGFWLVHSVPKFPNLKAKSYTWTGASHIYGQSFLCVSLNSAGLESVGYQLMFYHPDLYAQSIASQYTNLSALVGGKRFDGAHVLQFPISSGMQVTHFGKSNSWGKDVYEDLVLPHFKSGFHWETWRRSPVEPTYCTPQYAYNSINVNQVKFPDVSFSYTKDHSKWGVSLGSNPGVACVGGINRMTSQKHRGGGTLCLKSAPLWQSLNAIIGSADTCPH